jgi:hypothetical protein
MLNCIRPRHISHAHTPRFPISNLLTAPRQPRLFRLNTTMPPELDESSLPSIFQQTWKLNPDPHALPFSHSNPPFALTSIDWHQLSLTDADFTPHTWTNLAHLISTNQLDELKRWPSALKAYLAWTAHVKEKYGSVMAYLLSQRLFWEPVEDGSEALKFGVKNDTPLAEKEDYKILRNDWTYAFEDGIKHIVVWVKQRLPVDGEGALNEEGRRLVEGFVEREFRRKAGEVEEGSKVLWFKNTTNLQSVRSLEHFHVLVRDVDEGVLEEWMR